MSTATKSAIRAANLRQDWPWVKGLLEKCRAKTGEHWWPEDIYAAVSNGKAAMYVADDPQGVMVVYETAETWSQQKVLHVWVLVCEDLGTLETEGYELLDRLKEHTHAARITMDSPRKGWQKRGWKVRKYIYER